MIKATSRQWLDEHLETFVRPYLKTVPDIDAQTRSYWTPKLVKCLHACWTQAKRLAQDRTILLPGRDVWLFEVLARMEGWPTVFRKDFSTPVAKSQFVDGDWSKHHAFDTGYSGSVCKALKCEHWHLISWSGCPAPAVAISTIRQPVPLGGRKKKSVTTLSISAGTPKNHILYRVNAERYREHQLFPYGQRGRNILNNTGGYAGQLNSSSIFTLASMLEGHAKYWERAEVVFKDPSAYPSVVVALKPQELSQPPVFTNAAMVTRLIAESCL